MALEKLSDVTTKQRDVRVRIPWSDIEHLIAKAACGHIGLSGDDMDASVVKVELEQETAGSPSYHVQQWRGIATVTVKL